MKILKLLKKQLHNRDYLLLHLRVLILNKGSDVIISIHDTSFIVFYPWYKFYTNKVLSCSSSYKVDVVI